MNFKFLTCVLSITAIISLSAMVQSDARFGNLYIMHVKQEADRVNRDYAHVSYQSNELSSNSNQYVQVNYRWKESLFSDKANQQMTNAFNEKRKANTKTSKLKGGSGFNKFFGFDSQEPTVDPNSQSFKNASNTQAGLNHGQSIDPNKSLAAQEGRRRGVAAGILLGPINWLSFKILCNSESPQIGAGLLILTNALGFYNLKAQSTYTSDPCKVQHESKRSFWARLIIASTIATRVATIRIN